MSSWRDVGIGTRTEQSVDHMPCHAHAVVVAEAQCQIDGIQHGGDLEGGLLGIEGRDLAGRGGQPELRRENRDPVPLLLPQRIPDRPGPAVEDRQGWFLSIALWLENAARYNTLETGFAIVPGPILVPIFAAVSERLIKRVPVGVVVALGDLLFAGGVLLVLAAASTPVRYVTEVLPGWAISGIGIGLALPSMIASAAVDLPADQSLPGVPW
ncbi:hypothetical protein ABIA39_001674 [Nocardia sp. GAS34]